MMNKDKLKKALMGVAWLVGVSMGTLWYTMVVCLGIVAFLLLAMPAGSMVFRYWHDVLTAAQKVEVAPAPAAKKVGKL